LSRRGKPPALPAAWSRAVLASGAIAAALIIATPPSTKNAAQQRGPGIGKKLQVGTDHARSCTAWWRSGRRGHAHAAGQKNRPGINRAIFVEQACSPENRRRNSQCAGIACQINRRAPD